MATAEVAEFTTGPHMPLVLSPPSIVGNNSSKALHFAAAGTDAFLPETLDMEYIDADFVFTGYASDGAYDFPRQTAPNVFTGNHFVYYAVTRTLTVTFPYQVNVSWPRVLVVVWCPSVGP